MLGPWQWAALAIVPPALVALYFLKLRREPLEVPSTYLWKRSLEDMHVNSLWQRLRKSLLLLLQLLIVALVIMALLRPSWRGTKLEGDRFVFLVDNSASMSATDVAPTRLDEAKRRVNELIEAMKTGDVAMIISFADGARVEQLFTDDRRELRRRLELIEPTNQSTSLAEALRLASVLANPRRSSFSESDVQVADALQAKLYFFTDGNFADVPDFSLGNLEPVQPVWIGKPDAPNVAIVAFAADRQEGSQTKLQAFARLQNSGTTDVAVDVELLRDGELIDAQEQAIEAGEGAGVAFDLGELRGGLLELRVTQPDSLAVDNRAWTVIKPPRRASVLVLSPGNNVFEYAFGTDRAEEMAQVTWRSPEFLSTAEYKTAAATGGYDLVIFDRCAPPEPPRANTLYIGRLPAGGEWKAGEKVVAPHIIDSNRSHPLMQWVELGNVDVLEAVPITPPKGATALIESDRGTLFAVAPREGFEDAVLGFELIGDEGIGSTWPVRPSFPVFAMNVLQYLGGNRGGATGGSISVGKPVILKPSTPVQELTVTPPVGPAAEVPRGKQDSFHFTGTSQVGVYKVQERGQESEQFAVNLFDTEESDVKTRPERKFKIGHDEIADSNSWEEARRDAWKYVAMLALAVLLFEWYIYTRRTYL